MVLSAAGLLRTAELSSCSGALLSHQSSSPPSRLSSGSGSLTTSPRRHLKSWHPLPAPPLVSPAAPAVAQRGNGRTEGEIPAQTPRRTRPQHSRGFRQEASRDARRQPPRSPLRHEPSLPFPNMAPPASLPARGDVIAQRLARLHGNGCGGRHVGGRLGSRCRGAVAVEKRPEPALRGGERHPPGPEAAPAPLRTSRGREPPAWPQAGGPGADGAAAARSARPGSRHLPSPPCSPLSSPSRQGPAPTPGSFPRLPGPSSLQFAASAPWQLFLVRPFVQIGPETRVRLPQSQPERQE